MILEERTLLPGKKEDTQLILLARDVNTITNFTLLNFTLVLLQHNT